MGSEFFASADAGASAVANCEPVVAAEPRADVIAAKEVSFASLSEDTGGGGDKGQARPSRPPGLRRSLAVLGCAATLG